MNPRSTVTLSGVWLGGLDLTHDRGHRTYATLALRATFKDLPTPLAQGRAARVLVPAHQRSQPAPRTTARLATHVLEHHTHHAPDIWTTIHDRARARPGCPSTRARCALQNVEQPSALQAECLLRSEQPG